ncbi:DUF4839 domain-containing protein [Streptomyces sp. NPDC101171]|uniref:DUF4839 domain-containing protein n=1 Tax=Streptomyces sp. NPDC101171 TaxID=3366122 RepID=UPI0037FCA8C6
MSGSGGAGARYGRGGAPRGRVFLLGPGGKGPNTATGPAFKYEDVGILELELTGKKIPATVGAGDTFRFVAEVGEFDADLCLFFLDPVSTHVR